MRSNDVERRRPERPGDEQGRSLGVAHEVPAGGLEVVAGRRLLLLIGRPQRRSPCRRQGRPFTRPSQQR